MKCRTAVAVALAAFVVVSITASAQPTSEWVVSSHADSGAGTLREAILAANTSDGDDIIRFASAMTIRPRSPLPALEDDGITINGSGGSVSADIPPTVWIDGSQTGDSAGLELISPRAVVRGLGIIGFDRYGIGVIGEAASDAVIEGNWIGLRADGGASPNRLSGVAVIGGARGAQVINNRIGGNSVAERTGHGIVVGGGGSIGVEITGNVIGIALDGSAAANDDGILIVDSGQATVMGNTIGHSMVAGIELRETRQAIVVSRNRIGLRRDGAPAENDVGLFLGPGSALARIGSHGGNVIAGNRVGVAVEQGAREALIENNWVGLAPPGGSEQLLESDLPGALIEPNRERGISVIAGAAQVQVRNNYVAAGEYGIVVADRSTTRVSLTRNVVAGAREGPTEAAIDVRSGTEISIGGEQGLGNHVCGAEFGIRVADTKEPKVDSNEIGPSAATRVRFDSDDRMDWAIRLDDGVERASVRNNRITDAVRAGISVVGSASQDNSLLDNQFFGNGIEIDLGADGATPNDQGDRDRGPNALLNHPLLSEHEVRRSGNQIRSTFRGSATPGSYVQIYERTITGERVLVKRSRRANASGQWEATTLVLPRGELRALASTSAGATSEFSPSFMPSQRVRLTAGVNWFAWTGPSMSVAGAMSPLSAWLETVWVWSASEGRWRGWSPLAVGAGGLERLETGVVVRLQLSGRPPDEFFVPAAGELERVDVIELKRGFNGVTWLGRNVDSLEVLAEFDAAQPGLIGQVWQWEGDSWESIWPRVATAWDPGQWVFPALWIRAIRDGELSLP